MKHVRVSLESPSRRSKFIKQKRTAYGSLLLNVSLNGNSLQEMIHSVRSYYHNNFPLEKRGCSFVPRLIWSRFVLTSAETYIHFSQEMSMHVIVIFMYLSMAVVRASRIRIYCRATNKRRRKSVASSSPSKWYSENCLFTLSLRYGATQ